MNRRGRPAPSEAITRDREHRLLQYIARKIEEDGWAPGTKEMEFFVVGIQHMKARWWLDRLTRYGWIKTGSGARQIAITDAGRAKLKELEES